MSILDRIGYIYPFIIFIFLVIILKIIPKKYVVKLKEFGIYQDKKFTQWIKFHVRTFTNITFFFLLAMGFYVLSDTNIFMMSKGFNSSLIDVNNSFQVTNALQNLRDINIAIAQASITLLGFVIVVMIFITKDKKLPLTYVEYFSLVAFGIINLRACTLSFLVLSLIHLESLKFLMEKTENALVFFLISLVIAISFLLLVLIVEVTRFSEVVNPKIKKKDWFYFKKI